jgi:hypothetical protein
MRSCLPGRVESHGRFGGALAVSRSLTMVPLRRLERAASIDLAVLR